MIGTLFLAALLAASQTAPAATPRAPTAETPAPPQFSQEDRARLRCAAAFSIVAVRDTSAGAETQSSEIAVRGREFFVVTLADLMDAYALDREGVTRAVSAEAKALAGTGEVDKIMPACLLMLQSAGL
jgi:hypothetical protein